METIKLKDLTFKPYIRREEIASAIKHVAEQINKDLAGKSPLFLCVLNGAFVFAADLFCQLRRIELFLLPSFERLLAPVFLALFGRRRRPRSRRMVRLELALRAVAVLVRLVLLLKRASVLHVVVPRDVTVKIECCNKHLDVNKVANLVCELVHDVRARFFDRPHECLVGHDACEHVFLDADDVIAREGRGNVVHFDS